MKNKRAMKKKLKDFLKDEQGYISKDKVLKIGLGTISVLGIMGAVSNVMAAHTQHTNTIGGTTVGQCLKISHSSHSAHTNHSSY